MKICRNAFASKTALIAAVSALAACVLTAQTAAAADSVQQPQNQPREIYRCRKAEKIKIDGVLDEPEWRAAQAVVLREALTGGPLPEKAEAKMLWDEACFYAAFELEDRDVWGANTARDTAYYKDIQEFVKVYLDLDDDGLDYAEIHVNPLNCVYDIHFTCGVDNERPDPPRKWHQQWTCAWLQTAVAVQGTLNKHDDTDKGWTVELAIPWEALKDFSHGRFPPQAGEKVGVALDRVYHTDRQSKDRFYGTWPVIGEIGRQYPYGFCHVTGRWGTVILEK